MFQWDKLVNCVVQSQYLQYSTARMKEWKNCIKRPNFVFVPLSKGYASLIFPGCTLRATCLQAFLATFSPRLRCSSAILADNLQRMTHISREKMAIACAKLWQIYFRNLLLDILFCRIEAKIKTISSKYNCPVIIWYSSLVVFEIACLSQSPFPMAKKGMRRSNP